MSEFNTIEKGIIEEGINGDSTNLECSEEILSVCNAIAIILSLIILIIVIAALVSSIKKGIKDQWKGSRIAGLIVAIFFSPLYWILYACGVFKPKV